MLPSSERTAILVVFFLVGSAFAANEIHKDFHFKVHRRATVSILNQYGPISVKPTSGHQVVVNAILGSDKVEIDQTQRGNRISLVSHLLAGADAQSGRVEYQVLVPADTNITMSSVTGPLRAEGLRGDVVLEGATAAVDVRNVSDGHVHVNTLDGAVTVTDVVGGHVEITSVSGAIALKSVSGPLVRVNSNAGNVAYDGDFGGAGEYKLVTNTGDIEAIAPSYASIDVEATSLHGKVDSDFSLEPTHSSVVERAGSSFVGTLGKAASSVKLLSFSGKIHLKKRR
jgi:DUF4097 and DUF4098 domain-containing protein YvlB